MLLYCNWVQALQREQRLKSRYAPVVGEVNFKKSRGSYSERFLRQCCTIWKLYQSILWYLLSFVTFREKLKTKIMRKEHIITKSGCLNLPKTDMRASAMQSLKMWKRISWVKVYFTSSLFRCLEFNLPTTVWIT